MTTNSRRKFLLNAGLGLSGFTILPLLPGAKGASVFKAENVCVNNGSETIP